MSEEYPLFPELSESGKEEAQKLVDRFKASLKKSAEDVLRELYCDVVTHIETDSWANFRNDMLAGFQDYKTRVKMGDYDFKKIRQKILDENREELIKDMDKDLLVENECLKKEVERLKEWLEESRRVY